MKQKTILFLSVFFVVFLLSHITQALTMQEIFQGYDSSQGQVLGAATIALDSASSSGVVSTNSFSWFHTTGTGADFLLVGIIPRGTSESVTSVTYGGVNLNFLTKTSNLSRFAELWYLKNPNIGTNTISVNLTGTISDSEAEAVTFSGVDTTSPIEVSAVANSTASQAKVSLITVSDNDVVVDVLGYGNTSLISSGGRNEVLNSALGSGFAAMSIGVPKIPAGSVTMGWSPNVAGSWALVAAALKPSSGLSPTPTPTATPSPTPTSSPTPTPTATATPTPTFVPTPTPNPGGTVLLEDFSTPIRQASTGDLFRPYLGEDPGQTYSFANNMMTLTGSTQARDTSLNQFAPCSSIQLANFKNGCGLYWQMHIYPYTGTTGFTKGWIKSGAWDPNADRLRFSFMCNANVASQSTSGNIQIGTYTKPDDGNANNQGRHYYHYLNPNVFSGHWVYVEVNRRPQHQVGIGSGSVNWSDDPTWNPTYDSSGNLVDPAATPPVHYFDGLTNWYFDTQGFQEWAGVTCNFQNITFASVAGEPDNLVSSLTGTYSGSQYQVDFMGPVGTPIVKYDVAYSTSSMLVNGFSSGTSGGTVSSSGTGYPSVMWKSANMAESTNGMYFGIRPQGQNSFTEFFIPGTNGVVPTPPAPTPTPVPSTTPTPTPTPAPVITNLLGSNTTATSTIISWTTDQPTNGQVSYGLTSIYNLQSVIVNQSPLTTAHAIVFSGLTASTIYHFSAQSTNSTGQSAQTNDFTFTTLAIPVPTPTPSPTGTPVPTPTVVPTPSATPTPTPLPTPIPTPTTAPAPSGGGTSGGGGGAGSGGGSTPPIVVYIPPALLQTPNVTNATGFRLINNKGTFYLISNGQLHGITNPGMLASYGLTFSLAQTPSVSDLALAQGALLTPGDGSLVKSLKDPTVYLISGQQRFAFTSGGIFTSLGFKFSSVLVVTDPELQALPKASELNNGQAQHLPGLDINKNGTIYWINANNTLHAYTSLADYNSWHIPNDFSHVVAANKQDLLLPVDSNVVARVLQ